MKQQQKDIVYAFIAPSQRKWKFIIALEIAHLISAYYKQEGFCVFAFNQRPLGFSVIMDTRGRNAIVSSIQNDCNEKLGMKVASIIYEINGEYVHNLQHHDILKLITQQSTPFYIVFNESAKKSKIVKKSDSDNDIDSDSDSTSDTSISTNSTDDESYVAQHYMRKIRKFKNNETHMLKWHDSYIEYEKVTMMKLLSCLIMSDNDEFVISNDASTNIIKKSASGKVRVSLSDLIKFDQGYKYDEEIFGYLSKLTNCFHADNDKNGQICKYNTFHLSPDCKYLVWLSHKSYLEETHIQITEIRKIEIDSGLKTQKTYCDEISFTIYFGKTNNEKLWNSLTVTNKNEKEAIIWAQGLKILSDASKYNISADSNSETVIINLFSNSSQKTITSLLKQHAKYRQQMQLYVDFVMTKPNYRAIANAGQFDKIKKGLEHLDTQLRDIKSRLNSNDVNDYNPSSIKAKMFSCAVDLDVMQQKLIGIVRRPQKL